MTSHWHFRFVVVPFAAYFGVKDAETVWDILFIILLLSLHDA
jgi:hypothetical protein